MATLSPTSVVSFTLNGHDVQLSGVDPNTTLNEWIRSQLGLSGTKKMCGEGGCGCCAVSVQRKDPTTGKDTNISIISCLCPLYSVEGWQITTVEGIGNSHDGYHPIQERIAQYNGSQCGYCTPGMVMNMYSLLKESPTPTKQQVEDFYDGNICRCTGYRPILDAMKSFAVDADPKEGGKCIDIEDLAVKKCSTWCPKLCTTPIQQSSSSTLWFRPIELADVFTVFKLYSNKMIKLIAGDTGRGVFKDKTLPDVIVDLKGVPSLATVKVEGTSLSVGSTVPINTLITALESHKDSSPTSFPYLADHLKKVANVAVRNIGCWAGNLMMAHDNENFPSDVFTIMEAVRAKVVVASSTTDSSTYSLTDFLSLDMGNKVITALIIPFAAANSVVRTFKVMPRHQNSHAYVTAGFSWSLDPGAFIVQGGSPSIVFSGLQAHTVHAVNTENYMAGKSLTDFATLQGAMKTLQDELKATMVPPEASTSYRLNLSYALFYKFYLASVPDHISDRVKSAAVPFTRPVSQGYQSYDTVKSEYPVTEPMTKLTAKLQASGEAQYVSDTVLPNGLVAAFVLSSVGNATIEKIDASQALQMPGVVKFLSAADIPGTNASLQPPLVPFEAEPIFATDKVLYAGQAIGIIVADTQENADRAAKMVTVQYSSETKPVLTIADAIKADSFYPYPGEGNVLMVGDANAAVSSSARSITGDISCGTQYHFHMETQTCVCVPEDDSYSVYSATQWTDACQLAVATVLGIQTNQVNVSVKRVGGGFGAKIMASHQIASACALAAYHTRRPVKIHLDLETNMKMVGKRFPYYTSYKVGFTDDGVINGIVMDIYTDSGCHNNDQSADFALLFIDNAYNIPNWYVLPRAVKTNTAGNTFCRSPGSLPAIFIIESIMEHVGEALGIPAETVKQKNLYEKGQVTPMGDTLKYCSIKDMWSQLYQSADIENRATQVTTFNQQNRWRKRGISVVPLRWGVIWSSQSHYTVIVSIYATDGTVAIAHGGIEIGQGINTKVAQVAARELGISLDLIRIVPTNSLTNPNAGETGGSTTSEINCQGVINACKELNTRIDPVRQKMKNPAWKDLIARCKSNGIDLSAKAMITMKSDGNFAYSSYGVNCSEVEVDILTGEVEVLRSDILFDCGQSINPEIDIGQVEGAYVMGLGYWLTERFVYDEDSGEVLTHNTWEYKPPESKDIPIDFRVELLKNAPNPVGVLSSKASGEPPMCMSCSVLFAVKKAIASARKEIDNKDFFALSAPATVEDIQQSCLVSPSQFTL